MNVTIYTSPTCPHCLQLKEFLKNNNVSFEEVNVNKNKKAAEEIMKKSGVMGVPIIKIGEEIIAGFDEAELKRKLYLI